VGIVAAFPPGDDFKEVSMRAVLFSAAFAFAITQGAAFAADKPEKPAKAEKVAKDKKGGEVTLSGEMVCGKCTLNETKKCQNVLRVTEAGKETKYYLAENEVAKSNHEHVCSGPEKATVKGTVAEESGKKVLTASAITFGK
jgi:hypothetical protein